MCYISAISKQMRFEIICSFFSLWLSLFLVFFLGERMRFASALSSNVLTKVRFGGRVLYIKRDDQRAIQDTVIKGNKSRKLYHLSQTRPFPHIVASYGGAQSNSMLALAQLISTVSPSTQFYYFTKPLPKFLRDRPNGNLAVALQKGMTLVEIDNQTYDELPHQHQQSFSSNQDQSPLSYYWVPQGKSMHDNTPSLAAILSLPLILVLQELLTIRSNTLFLPMSWYS